MKLTAFALVLLTPLVLAGSTDPPGNLILIRPTPNQSVPQNSNLTFGFVSTNKQYYGLVQNIKMSYSQPDGTKVDGASFGPAITSDNSYSPAECRTFPGTSTLNSVNATQTGKCVFSSSVLSFPPFYSNLFDSVHSYTFFWDVIYVESSDSSKANSTYCGPPPFSKQNWSINSTTTVVDADLGTAVMASATSTTQDLPSKPTGKVNSGESSRRWSVFNWGTAVGMLAGIGMMV
jgi:hypothetical protein